MKMLKVVLNILLKPKYFFEKLLQEKLEISFVIKYMLLLNLIGPVFSFYSMHFIENISIGRSFLYAVSTYILDIISIIIFTYLVERLEKKDFQFLFTLAVFIYTPIWLSDVVDINQYLRPLSNLGLLYSLVLLYIAFSTLEMKNKKILFYEGVFILLYMLDAFIAEMIVQNPWVKMLIK